MVLEISWVGSHSVRTQRLTGEGGVLRSVFCYEATCGIPRKLWV